MRELSDSEVCAIVGAECSVIGLGKATVSTGIAGGVGGLAVGSVAVPGVGAVPGWVVGATLGSIGGALGYGTTCWWDQN